MQFSELNISKSIKRSIKDMHYTDMTPIQEYAIPPLLEKKDVMGQAQTGTGKTAAFAIPAIENIDSEIRRTQILIISPTRELAIQIGGEIRKFTKYSQGISCEVVYGGEPIDRQIRALRRNPAFVIGTPGRLLDHINRRVLRLNTIKTVILDEADEMLNMGFRGDIEKILKLTPEDRQTVLFSATMPSEVLQLAKTYQKDPVDIKIQAEELTVNNIEQYYVDLPKNAKVPALEALLEKYSPKRAIIFSNTKRQVDKLALHLQSKNYAVDSLHGDMTQRARTNVMNKFKRGDLDILIATDVAARGIDVKDIEIVFNYDIPSDMDFYVHRIGRTARAGKSGIAITFSCGKDQLHAIFALERFIGAKLNPIEIPDISVNSSSHSDGVPLVKKRGKFHSKGNNKLPGKPYKHTQKEKEPSSKDTAPKEKTQNEKVSKPFKSDALKSPKPPRSSKPSKNQEFKKAEKTPYDKNTPKAEKRSFPKSKNPASKISLDEYFKRSDEVNSSPSPQAIPTPKKPASPKAKSRIKYNGFTGRT